MTDHRDWVWYSRSSLENYRGQSVDAYEVIISQFLPLLAEAKTPTEFVFCPSSDTTNIVFPRGILTTEWKMVFKDAGFKEKQIPLKDAMEQAELKEALLRGSNFNSNWI